MKNSFYACFAIFTAILFTSCSKSTEDLTVPNSITSPITASTNPGSANYTFVSNLYGFKVVPTNSSLGHAVFTLEYNGNARTASYTLTYERIIPTEAHIHMGLPTENGPVVFDLGMVTTSPHKGIITLNDSQASDLVNGKLYIDVHSNLIRDGEIRAQIGKE